MSDPQDEGGTTERYSIRAVEALFNEALEKPTDAARSAWLRQATGGDEGLIAEVVALLDAHTTSAGFLEGGALLERADDDPESASIGAHVGGRIGPYLLIEELGEGGFGTVFRAEQREPVRRQVALKVIKLGMDTRQVIARFEAERQALALMDHPGIARVLDAGSTETGRPYFVMDLAPGIGLTRFCDDRRLSILERLNVFLDLCAAVQHAHQRGVIHRDLKPSNVLVAEVDGRVVPKVIDFGIAKATSEDLTEATLFTEQGQVIGTPVYMSPEQATGGTDVDTRADVYSLGVLLYELISGTTPFRAEDLRERAAAGDIGTFVREFETPAPSTRLTKASADVARIAELRSATPAELRSQVKGDLDWVVQCALESERDRRYESAAALARDVQRVLENRPVEASPPSTLYRAGKFLRRHRVSTAAAAAVLAAVAAGATVSVNTLRGKRDQGEVLTDVFAAAADVTGDIAGARSTTALERRINAAFGEDEPLLVGALSFRADALMRAGDLEGALDARRRALRVAERIYGLSGRETILARSAFGLHLARMGDLESGRRALQTALEADRNRDGAPLPALNEARLSLAKLHADEGDLAAAESLAVEADDVARTVASGDRLLRLDALEVLVDLRRRRGDVEATVTTWKAFLGQYATLVAPGSTALLRRRVEFGSWLASNGRTEDAARELRGALDALDAVGEPPVDLELSALRALNEVYSQDMGLAADVEAKSLLDRELDATMRGLDRTSPDYLETLDRLSEELAKRGELGRSTELLVERYSAYSDTTGNALGALPARTMLAQELAERANFIGRQDDLDPRAYVAARSAIDLALPYRPDDTEMLFTKASLALRTGEPTAFFGILDQLKRASDMDGEHPMLLAMQSIAWFQTPITQRLARKTLQEAQALAREPQFATSALLHETLDWADRVINGAAIGAAADDAEEGRGE
ncbi:MAG: serine/threonine-protein kinase [Planctomycetota bacterium]